MYAFGAGLEGIASAVTTAQLAYDPTFLSVAGLLALAAVTGAFIGSVMRAQRADEVAHLGSALPRPA